MLRTFQHPLALALWAVCGAVCAAVSVVEDAEAGPAPALTMSAVLSAAPVSTAAPTASAPAASAVSAASAAAPATRALKRPRLDALRSQLDLQPALPISGNNLDNGAPLTLSDAALLSLTHNPDVQAALFREEAFAQTRNAARGALLPRVELRLASGRGQLESVDPHVSTPRADSSAVLSQAIFDQPARMEWTRQQLLAAAAVAQRGDAESQAMLDAGNAWLLVLQQRVALELGGEYEKLLGELLRYVSERAAAGGASPAERERVNARVANVRSSLADTRAALQAALRNLQRLADVRPAALSLSSAPDLQVPDDAETALTQATASNAELLSARIEQQAADAERRGHRGRFLPRLGLEVTHSRARNASGTESYTQDTKAMAVLTVPLLSGGADYAQMRAAEARRNELEARAQSVSRRVVQDIETSYANLKASRERYVSVREEMEGNRKVVDAFRAQLVGGNRQLLDVLDAYQRLHQSRLDLVQVFVSTAQNEWRVAHLTGMLRNLAPADH